MSKARSSQGRTLSKTTFKGRRLATGQEGRKGRGVRGDQHVQMAASTMSREH